MTAAIAPTSFSPSVLRSTENPALLNLLIVDDERAVREAAREAALVLGYRAAASDSLDQAMRLLESQSIDVVLLDMKLPGASALKSCAISKAGGRILK